MKNKFTLIVAAVAVSIVGMACSFSTANISSFNFGKNDSANPPATSFDIADKIYAVAVVSNTSSKHKMRFRVLADNIQGKKKGDELYKQELDFEGARPVFLTLTSLPTAGDYTVEATLIGDDGKELDKKSGTFKVTGEAKTATAPEDKAPADKDASSDEKKEDKDDK